LAKVWLLTGYYYTIMIKIQNLIRQIIFFTLFCLANTTFLLAQVLTADQFEEKLKAVPQPQLIDVRTPNEFEGGHLVAAKNINIKDADFQQQIIKLDKSQPVFVYCLSGGRSKTAHEILAQSGFTQIYELEGGYLKWSVANKAVEGVPKMNSSNVGRFSKQEIADMIKDNKLVLLDYYATWCGPCKKMDPSIQRLKKSFEGKVKIVKIDTDKNKSIAIQNLVNELPTFVFYKNGKEFWRGVGEQDEEFLQELFELNVGK
jgi:thioredoxin 1